MSKLVGFIFDPRGLNTPVQTALYWRGKENKHEKRLCFSTQIVIPLTRVTATALYTRCISLNKLALRAAGNKISHGNYTIITLFTVIMYQVNLLHHS